jgi:hypothetical protein
MTDTAVYLGPFSATTEFGFSSGMAGGMSGSGGATPSPGIVGAASQSWASHPTLALAVIVFGTAGLLGWVSKPGVRVGGKLGPVRGAAEVE